MTDEELDQRVATVKAAIVSTPLRDWLLKKPRWLDLQKRSD